MEGKHGDMGTGNQAIGVRKASRTKGDGNMAKLGGGDGGEGEKKRKN